MDLTVSSSPIQTKGFLGANRDKCQDLSPSQMKNTMSICRSLQIQDDLDLSDQSISVLSTLIVDQDLIQGSSSLDLSLCSLTQAKLGPSKNIIVDDSAASNSAIVVAASPTAIGNQSGSSK